MYFFVLHYKNIYFWFNIKELKTTKKKPLKTNKTITLKKISY